MSSDLDDSDEESVSAEQIDPELRGGILDSNYYTFNTIGDIDGDIPDRDEVDHLLARIQQVLKEKAVREKNLAFKKILSFMATLCWDKVVKGKKEKAEDICLLMEKKLQRCSC